QALPSNLHQREISSRCPVMPSVSNCNCCRSQPFGVMLPIGNLMNGLGASGARLETYSGTLVPCATTFSMTLTSGASAANAYDAKQIAAANVEINKLNFMMFNYFFAAGDDHSAAFAAESLSASILIIARSYVISPLTSISTSVVCA